MHTQVQRDEDVPLIFRGEQRSHQITPDYRLPGSGEPFDARVLDWIRDNISELAPDTRMIATEGDSDGFGDIAGIGGAGGHDVTIVRNGQRFHLTPGRNGDCGAAEESSWIEGSQPGIWVWSTDPALSIVEGDTGGVGSDQLGALPQSYLLPELIELRVFTGGGVSFGWEREYILVR